MNTIFKKTEKILKDANIEEYKAEAKLIILSVSNLTLEEILLKDDLSCEDEILKVASLRAETKKPIQYILGFSNFMNEKFIVNENVLIPRDETEILVKASVDLIKNKNEKINVLDIGIGSGIISAMIAKNLKQKDIEILGVDISLDALEVAIENINKLGLERKVVIRKSDIFSKIRPNEKFDLIVSNPPYIPKRLENELDNIVVGFEPYLALFTSDDDGIEFYKKIIQDSKTFLKKDGFLAFEIGINQSGLVYDLLKDEGFKNIQIIKDLSKIDRVITAKIN